MDYLAALMLLSFTSLLFTSCGEQEPDLPGGGSLPLQSAPWIIGTWKGTQSVKRPGQASSSATVRMKFFANQTYHLSFPEHSSDFVKGEFALNSNGTMLLKVQQSSAKLYEPTPLPESFRFSHQSPKLKIFNQEVQLDLQASEELEEEESESAGSADELFSLFDTWTCNDDSYLWQVSILAEKTFYLRRYASNNRLPEERAGRLKSYQETPPQAVEEKKAHIVFYMDRRKLNLVFKITEASRMLKVEHYQGSIRPDSPKTISCFRR